MLPASHNAHGVSLWSNRQACLMPIIKGSGSPSFRFYSVTHRCIGMLLGSVCGPVGTGEPAQDVGALLLVSWAREAFVSDPSHSMPLLCISLGRGFKKIIASLQFWKESTFYIIISYLIPWATFKKHCDFCHMWTELLTWNCWHLQGFWLKSIPREALTSR